MTIDICSIRSVAKCQRLGGRGIAERAKIEGAIVGAGTVLNSDDLDAAFGAGARFVVSLGQTDRFGQAVLSSRASLPLET